MTTRGCGSRRPAAPRCSASRRSVICMPNRLPISSTATRAVRPRSSRNGLSSTMSTERTRSGIVQQLHDQMRLAIGGAARHRGADAGRDRRIEEIDVERHMQHAVLRPAPVRSPGGSARRRRIRRSRACRRSRSRRSRTSFFSSGSIERMPNRSSRSGPIETRGSSPSRRVEPGLAAQKRRRHAVHVAGLASSPACCSRHGRRATARTAAGPAPASSARRR